MIRFACLALTLAIVSHLAAAFERPSPEQLADALGNIREESETFQRLLAPDADFAPIPIPHRGDWLDRYKEAGQTFAQYRVSFANRPDATRHVIYLLPIGEFPEETSPSLEKLRDYTAAFFQMKVKLLPAYLHHELEFESRPRRAPQPRQLLTTSVLDFLKAQLPADAYCLLGVTMEDLYPGPSWNYVFGQATLRERVGVFSFVRYDPTFWGEPRAKDFQEVILRRSVKVLVHESAHMFGLPHCIYYACAINGANHLEEADSRPQHLCPVCLRKLHFAIRFDPIKRYEALARFYRQQRWYEEFDWMNRQLARATPAQPAQ